MRPLVAEILALIAVVPASAWAEDVQKPYGPPCTERENIFEFTEKPAVKIVGEDKYEISFAVKGNCDVTVALVDEKDVVVRHLGTGVLGANAPEPFQKNSLRQTLLWNGKDDLLEYVKEPARLHLRVMLGLKPEFDKLLLGKSAKNLSSCIWGVAVGPDGGYVFAKAGSSAGMGSGGHLSIRKFDHDGRYVMSLLPPAANLPHERLGGFGFIEYAPGAREVHCIPAGDSGLLNDRAYLFNSTDGNTMHLCQPLLLAQKLHFFGGVYAQAGQNVFFHRMNTDGSTEARQISVPLGMGGASTVRMAASPDGKWMYLSASGYQRPCVAVMRAPLTGIEPAKVFIGDPRAVGSDNQHFQEASGLDCDALGRLYVCDRGNNRIQIFSGEGKYLKTVPVDRPELVRLHPKTGALYVVHQGRVEGKSLARLTKFTSFDAPQEEWHADQVGGQALAVDAWTARPRLWLGSANRVLIYEEDSQQLKKVVDFTEDAKKEEGANYLGQWGGAGESGDGKVVCDPVREQLYFANAHVFNLRSGLYLRTVRLPGHFDDIAFDKRGYMHGHFNPSSQPGVGRLQTNPDGSLKECPYDYGDEGLGNWSGIIKTKDQLGAKFFQDGVGVNMMGDVAEQCNIYYAPKMEEEGVALAMSGAKARSASGEWCEEGMGSHDRAIKEMEKRGEQVYSIRREPGIPLVGGTIFTYDRSGELRQECAVNTGGLINGVQLDEDLHVYFVFSGTAMRAGKPFLYGKGGTLGAPDDKRGANPYTGTLMKTIPHKKAGLLLPQAPVPLEKRPGRPADLAGGVWVEGMEWLYAGASPIVGGGCSCPTQRLHLDWFKRAYVPEAYRHSFGVLDPAGNVIMHLGTYGNYDSGNGAQSRIPVGGDHIALFMPRFISGTDNHLVFSDWGERLVALKIAYHAEARVPIRTK